MIFRLAYFVDLFVQMRLSIDLVDRKSKSIEVQSENLWSGGGHGSFVYFRRICDGMIINFDFNNSFQLIFYSANLNHKFR